MAFTWKCPYCGRDTTVTDHDYEEFSDTIALRSVEAVGHILDGRAMVCPNPSAGT